MLCRVFCLALGNAKCGAASARDVCLSWPTNAVASGSLAGVLAQRRKQSGAGGIERARSGFEPCERGSDTNDDVRDLGRLRHVESRCLAETRMKPPLVVGASGCYREWCRHCLLACFVREHGRSANSASEADSNGDARASHLLKVTGAALAAALAIL